MSQAERKEEAELTLRERRPAVSLGARFCAFCSAACFQVNGKRVNANIDEILRESGEKG